MLLIIYLSDSQNVHSCPLAYLNVNKDNFEQLLCAFSPVLPSISSSSSSSFLILVVAAVTASIDVALVVVLASVDVAVPLLFCLMLEFKRFYDFSKAYRV